MLLWYIYAVCTSLRPFFKKKSVIVIVAVESNRGYFYVQLVMYSMALITVLVLLIGILKNKLRLMKQFNIIYFIYIILSIVNDIYHIYKEFKMFDNVFTIVEIILILISLIICIIYYIVTRNYIKSFEEEEKEIEDIKNMESAN